MTACEVVNMLISLPENKSFGDCLGTAWTCLEGVWKMLGNNMFRVLCWTYRGLVGKFYLSGTCWEHIGYDFDLLNKRDKSITCQKTSGIRFSFFW